MAKTYYWKGGASGYGGHWNSADNWFYDEACTSVASEFPGYDYDICIIGAGATENITNLGEDGLTAEALICRNATYHPAWADYALNVRGAVLVTGDGASCQAAILGACVLTGAGSFLHANNAGGITGDCIFAGLNSYFIYDGVSPDSNIVGNCIFSGNGSYNDSRITGHCIFSGGIGSAYCGIHEHGVHTGSVLLSGLGAYVTDGSIINGHLFCVADYGYSGATISGSAFFTEGDSASHNGDIAGSLIKLPACTNFSNTGTATRYPLDVLATGF